MRKWKLKRIREGKTNYWKRLALLKSGKPRLVIRKGHNSFLAQVVVSKEGKDVTVASACSRDLVKLGYRGHPGNTPAGYLVGRLIAKRALEKGIKEAVLDIKSKGSSIFAVLKGALDGGLNVPHSPEILPPEERVMGEHIARYAEGLSEEERKKRFSLYYKKGLDPLKLPEHVKEVMEAVK